MTQPDFYDDQTPIASDLPPKGGGVKLWIWRTVIFVLPVLILGGAIIGSAAMSALKPVPEEKEEAVKALPVLVDTATTQDVRLTVKAQGEVEPRTQIDIVPQVSGRIVTMSPKLLEGAQFNRGDLLFQIEPAEYDMRVIQARANVVQAETALAREQSEAENAKIEWQKLGLTETPSPLTLREPQMAQARATLEAAKAQLAEAELNLQRTRVYAPFSGRVTQVFVDRGAFVTVGSRVAEIYATDIMDVALPLTNRDLREAGLTLGYQAARGSGIPVELSADVAEETRTWTGEIVRTDSRLAADTRVLFAYVEVVDPFGAASDDGVPLAPGLFVDAQIAGQMIPNAVVIPRAALRGNDQVYVAMPDETLQIRPVSVLSSNRESAILASGIAPGDAVITSPIRGVANGMKIEVVERTQMASTGTVSEGE